MNIPNSVLSIGWCAFKSCSNLASVTIGNSVKTIGDFAFDGCTSLTMIDVDYENPFYSSINGILYNKEASVLIRCAATNGIVVIPNSVSSIQEYAFNWCKGLVSIIIPNSVITIGHDAFLYCRDLTSVTIGNSTTSIGNSAFFGCI